MVKRSKFINDVRHHIASCEVAREIADLAEQAGVRWDPEIERLELEVDGDGVIVVDGRDRMWLDLSLVDDERPLSLSEREKIKELLAYHNFFHRLSLGDHDGGDFSLALLRKLIREEREKLR